MNDKPDEMTDDKSDNKSDNKPDNHSEKKTSKMKKTTQTNTQSQSIFAGLVHYSDSNDMHGWSKNTQTTQTVLCM